MGVVRNKQPQSEKSLKVDITKEENNESIEIFIEEIERTSKFTFIFLIILQVNEFNESAFETDSDHYRGEKNNAGERHGWGSLRLSESGFHIGQWRARFLIL